MSGTGFDLFIIGAGSGGVRAARMAAQRGARVAVAEDAALGGTCVNLGCIPKKLYSFAAHYAESFEEAHGFGWSVGASSFDWETLKANRRVEISRLNDVYGQLLTSVGVTLIRGRARVVGANEVEVGGVRHPAERIVVATGGWPVPADVPGGERAISSNEIFDLARFPERLVVIGGGYIACEFASIFNGLGARVTQLYRGEQILRGFDRDIRNHVAAEMIKKGVDIRVGATVRALEAEGDGSTRVVLGDGSTLAADAVLYATGRVPNTAGLGLEAAGVKLDVNGAVLVDDRYRTNVPSIYAVGDVIDRVQLTPVALAEAMALVDDLFGGAERHVDYLHIPDRRVHPSEHRHHRLVGGRRARPLREDPRLPLRFQAAAPHALEEQRADLDEARRRRRQRPRRRPAHGRRRRRRDDPGLRGRDEGGRDQGDLRRHARHSPDRRRGVRDDARTGGGIILRTP